MGNERICHTCVENATRRTSTRISLQQRSLTQNDFVKLPPLKKCAIACGNSLALRPNPLVALAQPKFGDGNRLCRRAAKHTFEASAKPRPPIFATLTTALTIVR